MMKKSCLKPTSTTTTDATDESSTTTNDRRYKYHVCFGELEIWEFPLILGDNPHCDGAPLQLAWHPIDESVVDIDFYEYTRQPRKSKKKFRIPHVDREVYLLSIGYNMDDILDACDQGRKIRKDRYNSFHNKKWDRFNVVFESAKEKLKSGLIIQQRTISAKTA